MRKLNTSAGILEVMGAPLTGTDLRAYVMSGGGITLKKFRPRLGSKRCFLIFPIQGAERKGLVSVEVKKKKGQVTFTSTSSKPAVFFKLSFIVSWISTSVWPILIQKNELCLLLLFTELLNIDYGFLIDPNSFNVRYMKGKLLNWYCGIV